MYFLVMPNPSDDAVRQAGQLLVTTSEKKPILMRRGLGREPINGLPMEIHCAETPIKGEWIMFIR